MNSTVRVTTALAAALALAACQHPLATSDAGGTDAPATDAAPSGDVTDPHATLSYMPAGCTYTVHTSAGTLYNQMGQDGVFGTAPAPTHLHVTWASDPSTTAAVLWNTDQATLDTQVQYGTSMAALTSTARGHVTTGGLGMMAAHVHETHVCGLTPDTTYYYRVGGDGNWTTPQSFHTAPAPGGTGYNVNFAVAGDSRDDLTIWHMVNTQLLGVGGAMRAPDFTIFSGDAIELGTVQSAWDEWFDSATPTMSTMPYVMVHGNHDALAINYLVQFAQPQSADATQDELYFALDYGPIHLVVLNDTPPNNDYAGVVQGTERSWLDANLAAVDRARTPWVVVVHHKPAFSSSTHSTDTDTQLIRATWPPVYDAHQVDVVFNGHDHDFEISQPLRGDGTVAPSGQHGTVYVTAAGAGAMLYPSSTNAYTRYSESVINFVLVHATEHSLELTPYRIDGTTIDQGHTTLTR